MVVVILLGALWLAGYAVAVRWWPWTNCRRCRGGGKSRSPSGKAFRRCPRCKGTGRRLRLGRRLLNAVSERARKAQV